MTMKGNRTMKYVVFFILAALSSTASAGSELYVSTEGRDTNRGSQRRPFATLTRARDAVRELKANKGLPEGGVTIHLRGGEYALSETFVLTPEDSGAEGSPIVYTAYRDEEVRIVSKRAIGGWERLSAPWPAGLPDAARGKVFAADIPKGWRFHFLYVNDASQPAAKTTQSVNWRRDWKRLRGAGAPGPEGRMIHFAPGQPLADIPSNGDAEISLITAWWWNIVAPITAVDPTAGTALLHSRCTVQYGNLLSYDGGFYVLRNALPLLDEPGEWVVDTAAGRVYYWPPDDVMAGKTVFAPVLYELIRFQGDEEEQGWARQVEHVHMTGLRFMYTDRTPESEYDPKWLTRNAENPDAMIYLQGVRHCTFDNNLIAFSGSQGIALDHFAQQVTLTRNEIAFSSSGGIQITGYGPGEVDVNKSHLIERNFIHNIGLDYMHSCAISIYGSNGNIIRFNFITDGPYAAVSIVGMPARQMNNPGAVDTMDSYGSKQSMYQARWAELEKHRPFDNVSMRPFLHSGNNLIDRNICDHYMQKLDDGGALYTWEAGTHNVWTGNVGERRVAWGKNTVSLHLDDDTMLNVFTDNLFWSPGREMINNSYNDTNVLKDNEIGPDKPARYDAARQAILDLIRAKGKWRDATLHPAGDPARRE
jgi:hypothetical protein